MRRYAPKTDENQPEIVQALRDAGCSVQSLSFVGKGCPDLLVGRDGRNFLLEVKWPLGTPSHRALTPDQAKWHREWRGAIHVVYSALDALRIIGNHDRTVREEEA